ncbi:MAG: response regulator [Proteobacteria bacterium]|nr:response regulator [Pseudomonadota bacterium]
MPNHRILVVDDDPEILSMLSVRLGLRGYQVSTANDGHSALTAARHDHPDLVLLDVMMPGKSGWEVARALKQDPDTAGIKIVIVSAIGEKTNELTSPLYGADAFVDKPFEFERLETIIGDLLA